MSQYSDDDLADMFADTGPSVDDVRQIITDLLNAREDGEPETAWRGISPDPVEGTVYYVRTCCRIGIGFTTDMPQRMATLQPDEILATEPGSKRVEAARHRQFAADRIQGEWFNASPALLAHTRALRAGRDGARLVDTEAASLYTGRDAPTLRRWAREGRITRYKRPQGTMWDVFELPPKGSAPPPSAVARRAVQRRLDLNGE